MINQTFPVIVRQAAPGILYESLPMLYAGQVPILLQDNYTIHPGKKKEDLSIKSSLFPSPKLSIMDLYPLGQLTNIPFPPTINTALTNMPP
jgi:hypothetical protein